MNIEKFLTDNGYVVKRNDAYCRLDDLEFVAYKKTTNTKDCICNDKPPQLVVKCNNWREVTSFEVELVGETDIEWCNLKFYSLLEDTLINKLPQIEVCLTKAWEMCWSDTNE